MKNFSTIKRQFKEFHTKKPHLEFFTALLTIPMLLTVLALNLNNLKGEDKKNEANPTPIVINQGNTTEREVIVTKAACEPGLGEFSITSPSEDDEVSDNPVMVDVNYDSSEYCEAVWSYRISGGRWSDYDDRSIALYNLNNGNIKLDIRVKSVVNSEQETYTRNFVYSGQEATPTLTPTNTPVPAQ